MFIGFGVTVMKLLYFLCSSNFAKKRKLIIRMIPT